MSIKYELTIKQLNKLLEKHINESRTYVIVYSIRGTNSFEEETINSNDDIDTLMTKFGNLVLSNHLKNLSKNL